MVNEESNVVEMPSSLRARLMLALPFDDNTPGRVVLLELADIADQAESVRDRLTAVKAIGVVLRDFYPAVAVESVADESGVDDLMSRASGQ